ncbi:hypothetical protein AOLI_G00031330 [Acnodon oligacanthus]
MKRRGTAEIAASRIYREPAGESIIWYSNLSFRDLLRRELLCKHTANHSKKAKASLVRIQKSPCGPLLILFAEDWDVLVRPCCHLKLRILFQILAVLSQHAHKRQTQRDNRDIPPPNVNTGQPETTEKTIHNYSAQWVIQEYECTSGVSLALFLVLSLCWFSRGGKSSPAARILFPMDTMDTIATETGAGCLSLEHNTSYPTQREHTGRILLTHMNKHITFQFSITTSHTLSTATNTQRHGLHLSLTP